MIKKTNYLANDIDKLEKKGQVLPTNIAVQYALLQKYTTQVREILQQNLPMADFTNCFVVGVDCGKLTISVDSITLANHLRYMSNQHLQNLKVHSNIFFDIVELKIIATHHAKH